MENEIVQEEVIQEEVVKDKKKVEYFTDEMLHNMYVFQPALSSRGWGGDKKTMDVVSFGRNKRK